MAAGGAVQELCEELSCSICLEYFRDPVSIAECGHSFCRDCLVRSWGESEASSCPQCREAVQRRSLKPNRQLANVVEIAKKLSLQREGGGSEREGVAGKWRTCEKHQEPLKLFCKDDQALICVVCDRSKEHRDHRVIPVEEAPQGYKDKIFNCLETLRTEREEIRAYLADAEKETQKMLKIAELERQMTVSEFRRLRQLLTEQENRLLAQIEEVKKEIARKRNWHVAELSGELASLKGLIWSLESFIREMEEKHEQPVSELLQDIRSTLQRCEEKKNFENPEVFPTKLKWRLQGCCDISPFLGGVIKQLKDTLVSGLQMQKANVTLHPAAANAKHILSKDRKSIKCQSKARDLTGGIYYYYVLLGCERFTTGCHFWEVVVGHEEAWAVGVAKEPLKSGAALTAEEGIWAVERSGGRYRPCRKGIKPSLNLSGELKKIRVCLNYAGGQVAFFDADRADLLYRFSGASFSGEALRPFFAVCGKGYLRLCP